MERKKLKLGKNGKLLEGTTDEQIKIFSEAFPKTEEEMEDSLWFFDRSCPCTPVWILDDGSLEWG